jgi:hypothetical protein
MTDLTMANDFSAIDAGCIDEADDVERRAQSGRLLTGRMERSHGMGEIQ